MKAITYAAQTVFFAVMGVVYLVLELFVSEELLMKWKLTQWLLKAAAKQL